MATAKLVESDRDIGVVRSLICQKALPLHFEFSNMDPGDVQTEDVQSVASGSASGLELEM